jgi:hypothetical protein
MLEIECDERYGSLYGYSVQKCWGINAVVDDDMSRSESWETKLGKSGREYFPTRQASTPSSIDNFSSSLFNGGANYGPKALNLRANGLVSLLLYYQPKPWGECPEQLSRIECCFHAAQFLSISDSEG